jgi:hypothetical protein
MLFDQLTNLPAMENSRQMWIMKTIMDELMEEMSEFDEVVLAEWFSKCGLMLEWVSTGKVPESDDEFLSALAIEGPEDSLQAAENAGA